MPFLGRTFPIWRERAAIRSCVLLEPAGLGGRNGATWCHMVHEWWARCCDRQTWLLQPTTTGVGTFRGSDIGAATGDRQRCGDTMMPNYHWSAADGLWFCADSATKICGGDALLSWWGWERERRETQQNQVLIATVTSDVMEGNRSVDRCLAPFFLTRKHQLQRRHTHSHHRTHALIQCLLTTGLKFNSHDCRTLEYGESMITLSHIVKKITRI